MSYIYEKVTKQIIEALEGTLTGKWERPWSIQGLPVNLVSGKPYRGINFLTLLIAQQSKGYSSNIWATYKQWAEKGAQVRKGEKGTAGVYYGQNTKETENGDEKTFRFAKGFSLFNAEQVNGYEVVEPLEFEPIEAAEAVWSRFPGEVVYGCDEACYIPSLDILNLPNREQFKSAQAFYGTAFHEGVHWTGPRLDRDLSGRFGDESYAMEELIAEIGAAMLVGRCGLEPSIRDDHAKYIKSWLKVLRDDDRAIVHAASQAQKAADYLYDAEPDSF